MLGLFLSKEYGDDILFKAYFAQLLVRMNKEVSFIENEDELNEKNNIILTICTDNYIHFIHIYKHSLIEYFGSPNS